MARLKITIDGKAYWGDTDVPLHLLAIEEKRLEKPFGEWNVKSFAQDFLALAGIVLSKDHDEAGVKAVLEGLTAADMADAIEEVLSPLEQRAWDAFYVELAATGDEAQAAQVLRGILLGGADPLDPSPTSTPTPNDASSTSASQSTSPSLDPAGISD